MNHVIMAFLFLVSSQTIFAETFSSTIHSIGFGKGIDSHIVRFDNSRVSFIDHADQDLLTSLVQSTERNEMVEVQVDTENTVIAAQTVGPSEFVQDLADEKLWQEVPEDPFKPAVIKDYKTLQTIFKRMRKDYTKKGECYSRAHVWAYEEHKKSGLNLMKNFMFFTERYIRKYKFHWWFHVTPMMYWENFTKPRTLDRRYTSGPRQTKTWSDVFVKSKRTCKKISKFDDFWLNQSKQDCYHIHTSMYYVIPRDIEKRDLTGKEKTAFSEKEIRRAYNNGFKP